MAAIQSVLFILLICGISFSSAEMDDMESSGNNTTTGCDQVECMGGGTCMEDDEGNAYCICPLGKTVSDNNYWCKDCETGYWGDNCNMSCVDSCGGKGHFKSCDVTDGECVCNDCWEGATCNISKGESEGYSCVLDYLESIEKELDSYGGHVPMADTSSLRKLAAELVDDTTIVQDDSVNMKVVDRDEVDARPLMRFSFTLKDGPGNTDYDNAVGSIKDKVKTGEIRGTLIIDESDEDSGKVTLNA